MRIVLTFALPSEFAPWRKRSNFSRIHGDGAPIYRTCHGQDEIYALITGMSTRGLRNELQQLLAKPADLCIASGLTGALKKEHRPGTILVAGAVRTETKSSAIPSDASLVAASVECGAVAVDCFYTSNSLVTSQSEKNRLSEVADAVDMESFQVMYEARHAGVPAVAIRAVSDSSDSYLPIDFSRAMGTGGQLIWSRVLQQLAMSPLQFFPFVKFARESIRATRNLSVFLERYVNAVSSGGKLRPVENRMVM